MIESLKQTAKSAVNALLEAGADKALCSVQYKITHEFNIDGGEFSLFRTLFDKQMKMNAIVGGRKGVVTQNRYDTETIRTSAAACIAAASSAEPDENWDVAPLQTNEDFVQGAVSPDLDKLFFRCKELLENIKERFPKILVEQAIVSHEEAYDATANSRGVLFTVHEGQYSVMLMFSGHDGEKASSFFSTGVTTDNLDRPFLSLGSIEKDLGDVEREIETVSVDGKFEGTMVLAPACAGDLLGTMLELFAGEQGLLSGTSPWKDKLGETVADARITIRLAPLNGRIICGRRVTAEGYRAEDFDVIRNGRLNSFALGLYASNKLGLPRGKNDSRNLIIESGDVPLDKLIASIDRGILVGRFSGGEPSANGDFSGVAKNSFLIENGRIGAALSETMIGGNMADMLHRLRGISAEQVADGFTVLPYLAFDGVTVSGK